MGNDNLHLKRSQERKRKQTEILNQRENNYLIVTEGIETELNYFNELIKNLKIQYPNINLNFKVEGKGMNTVFLTKTAERLQMVVDGYRNRIIPYAKTFVVFDKDSFLPNEFNRAIEMCNNSGFIPLWSNQAIEYWFLLHFNKHEGKIDRNDYEARLNNEFIEKQKSPSDSESCTTVYKFFDAIDERISEIE